MRKLAIPLLMLSMWFSASAVQAAGKMKSGLWEMRMESDMMKNMPKISREQMEKMRRLGVNVPQMQDGAMVTKACISKEMAEREDPPQMTHKESGCEARNYRRTASGYSLDLVCDGANMKGEGTVKGTFAGDESFRSVYDFTGVAKGKPVSQHHEVSAKWISAACGDVKPPSDVAKKNK